MKLQIQKYRENNVHFKIFPIFTLHEFSDSEIAKVYKVYLEYYFNKDFDSLPDHVKKELQIMCVLFTEEIGGIFTLEFDDHGNLQFKTEATEADGFYDDIGGALKIKKLRVEKEELLESLEMYYRVFFLGEDVDKEKTEE